MENYAGMTVNERLYVSGLMKQFDKAVREKDTQKVIEILNKIEIGQGNISPILKSLDLE